LREPGLDRLYVFFVCADLGGPWDEGVRFLRKCENGRRRWFRLLEKGNKHHEVPVHHKAQDYVAEYLEKRVLSQTSLSGRGGS